MSMPLLATKFYIPPARSHGVLRPRLVERLNAGLHGKLTLISAPAGFGKTTLLGEWLAGCQRPAAWLSLDAVDADPIRFLSYLIAAVQTLAPQIGAGALIALHSPQPPPVESLLTELLNEIVTLADPLVLVLDDYHVIESHAVDQALTYLVEHLPAQMHLVIATREDPHLPLARLRARGHLTEVRAADLRFTPAEAAAFLTEGMDLSLSATDIARLSERTEGWIAGLQFAALALQGHPDTTRFIQSFTGSHHFVLDYLVEEVLGQQEAHVQRFLLHTSILERMSGPLCDAVVLDASVSGQATLEYLERANLFIVPLDNERRWYRYHHLFAELLRQRLQTTIASSTGDERNLVAALHRHASVWYEEHGFDLDAFHHAVAAHDIDRAAHLVEGEGMSLPFLGAAAAVLSWLESLSTAELNARPSLWVVYASAALFAGQTSAIEPKLQAAEAALQGAASDDKTHDLIGRIASMRATSAVMQHDVDTILAQSRRALEYLHPDNLLLRTAVTWTLGYAYQLQGDRAAASQIYADIIAAGKSSGDSIYTLAATVSLGQVQETNNQLSLATQTYQRALELAGDPPLGIACEAHLGLARILYQWNDLEAAWQHGQQCLQLTQRIDSLDTTAACDVLLARLKLSRGDVSGATVLLDGAESFVRRHRFAHRMADVAEVRVLLLLRQGLLSTATEVAQAHQLPISQARVHLAQGETSAALTVLESWRQQAEVQGWQDERLKVLVLLSVVHYVRGEKDLAMRLLDDALALAEPAGSIRLFVDEGMPMAHLLSEAAARGAMPDYLGKLRAAFEVEGPKREGASHLHPVPPAQSLPEPLSQREIHILQLIAQGLSNREIGERLFLALDTVKGYNRRIFGKLQVQRRTEAIARARQLGLL
jgi:LuxR family transcriptional regulator, maltose regulon positive regulatory protein